MNVIISNKYTDMLSSLQIDVIKTMNGEFEVRELVKFFDKFFFEKAIIDITAIKGYKSMDVIKELSIGLDMSKVILLLDDDPMSTTHGYLSKLVSMQIYNFTKNNNGIKYLMQHPNSYKDVAHFQGAGVQQSQSIQGVKSQSLNTNAKIIGFRNLTVHSGTTTLIYMLYMQLRNNYKVSVVELEGNDFSYFREKNMHTARNETFPDVLNSLKDQDIILVDLGNSPDRGLCYDIIYLIEPSPLKVTKMFAKNPTISGSLVGKKVVLNQSVLSEHDAKNFEFETKIKTFFNIPPLNERKHDHICIDAFAVKLGFIRQDVDEETAKKSFFGIFN